nr:ribonuclease H-like domain-containing protein [Tanacetum cinerariifolium]
MAGDDNRNGDHPETSNTSPPVPPPTQQIPYTVSSIKLPILKKGEYDIWAMKMEHYLSHTDYLIWQVIHNGNGPISVITDTNGMIKVLPSKTAKEVIARERERKARTTLLMVLPEDHLVKFYKMSDAKEMWEAIKSRFGNYMPSRPDVEMYNSKFTYGLKQTSVNESDSKPSEYASCDTDSSVETTTYMLEPVNNALKVVCEPKVWTDAPIIEEYESDSDNDSVSDV